MPDIDFQRIELNIIPKQGEQPVIFYASQYETTRPFIADLMWGDSEFAPGPDCWAEIDIRKNDDNLVVITEDVAIDNNEVSVILPVQALTCIGKNIGQVKIYAGEDQLIASLNFILEVQPDPLAGGVTSDTAIDNLESQIAAIVPEVIGEDYYDKTEVDALLADKADKATTYTKSETDALLNQKPDFEDLPDMSDYYTKLETNSLLSSYVETSYLTTNYYTRSDTNHIFVSNSELQLALQLEGTASGSIATFETAAPAQRLAALKCNFLCSGGNGTPSTPIPLVPYTELNVTNCGVNLWDEQWEVGGFDADGSANLRNDVFRTKNYIQVPPNTVLHIHQGNLSDSDWCYPVFYDINKTPITRDVGYGTITMPANAYYLRVQFNTAMGNTYADNISINYPATDTSYHAYNADTITIDLDGTRYGGYVDANNGKLVLTFAVVDLGTLNYQDATSSGTHYFYINSGEVGDLGMKAESYPTSTNIISPIFTAKSNNNWIGGALTNDYEFCRNSNNVCFRYDSISTTADFKTAMDGINMVYELATPIEVDISPEYLNAHTGINNVFHDGNGTTEVKYKDTIQHYIDTRV